MKGIDEYYKLIKLQPNIYYYDVIIAKTLKSHILKMCFKISYSHRRYVNYTLNERY